MSLRHSNNHRSVAFRHRYSGDIIDNGLEILIPLEAALTPGTYLLTVELRDSHRNEALGYMHELVIQHLGTEKVALIKAVSAPKGVPVGDHVLQ